MDFRAHAILALDILHWLLEFCLGQKQGKRKYRQREQGIATKGLGSLQSSNHKFGTLNPEPLTLHPANWSEVSRFGD